MNQVEPFMTSRGPVSWFARSFRGRWLAAAAVVGAAVTVWIAWLGWPVPERVTGRMTTVASSESSEWLHAGPGLLTRSVQVTGGNGLTVPLRVLRPTDGIDASAAPLPIVVLLGGHRTGRDAIELVGHPGRLIVVALDYPYDGPERLRGFRQIAGSLPRIRRALLDTPASVSLALDWVLQQPWANPGQVELVGVSLGTQFAAAAAAADDRFTRVWFVQGAADSRRWLVHQLEPRVASGFLREAAATGIWWLAHGASLDPRNWVAQIAPRPVVVIGAREDSSLPQGLVTALYDRAEPPRRLAWTDGGHVNPRRAETVRPLLELILGEMERQDDLPEPAVTVTLAPS
jgi:hypothetical protein